MDHIQESSPLVKLQDAARATAEMWPRLNGASPRREGLGTEQGTELEPGTGRGRGFSPGVRGWNRGPRRGWSLIAQVRECSRDCSIPPPGTGLGPGTGRG